MRPNYELCHVVVRITQRMNHFRKGDVLVIDPKRAPSRGDFVCIGDRIFCWDGKHGLSGIRGTVKQHRRSM